MKVIGEETNLDFGKKALHLVVGEFTGEYLATDSGQFELGSDGSVVRLTNEEVLRQRQEELGYQNLRFSSNGVLSDEANQHNREVALAARAEGVVPDPMKYMRAIIVTSVVELPKPPTSTD